MRTIDDLALEKYVEARIPDLKDPELIHLAQYPGGCTCGRNYAAPCYMPCPAVNLVRSGAPLDELALGRLDDFTPVYVLAAKDSYYSRRTHGYAQGLWFHRLAFDGRHFYVLSTHADTNHRRTLLVDDWRQFRTRY